MPDRRTLDAGVIMRAAIASATITVLSIVTPAAAEIDRFDFPSRAQVADALDLARPTKISISRSPVDTYFGVLPKRCDITHHLGLGTENRQTGYYYSTPTYIVYPSIEIRRYGSVQQATARFRDVRKRLRDCAGRLYKDPPNTPTGGKLRIDRYQPPAVGRAAFGLTASYCCEGGPAQSRIIVSRIANSIVWTQAMNYGSQDAPMPEKSETARLARVAVRLAD